MLHVDDLGEINEIAFKIGIQACCKGINALDNRYARK